MTVEHLEYKEAVEELESLVGAQTSMLNFVKKIEFEAPPALHHIKLIGKLQQVIDGRFGKRLAHECALSGLARTKQEQRAVLDQSPKIQHAVVHIHIIVNYLHVITQLRSGFYLAWTADVQVSQPTPSGFASSRERVLHRPFFRVRSGRSLDRAGAGLKTCGYVRHRSLPQHKRAPRLAGWTHLDIQSEVLTAKMLSPVALSESNKSPSPTCWPSETRLSRFCCQTT